MLILYEHSQDSIVDIVELKVDILKGVMNLNPSHPRIVKCW